MVGNVVFRIKIGDWKDFMFRNDKFPGFGYPYTLFESKKRVLIQITLCRNARIQMDLSKNNSFSTEEAINYTPRTEKRKKVPICEMLEPSGSLCSPMLPILSWKLKIIAYRDSSTIHPSSKLELLCQYKMTSWHYIVTKSSIIDDLGVRDPPLAFLFSMQNITKKIKI